MVLRLEGRLVLWTMRFNGCHPGVVVRGSGTLGDSFWKPEASTLLREFELQGVGRFCLESDFKIPDRTLQQTTPTSPVPTSKMAWIQFSEETKVRHFHKTPSRTTH